MNSFDASFVGHAKVTVIFSGKADDLKAQLVRLNVTEHPEQENIFLVPMQVFATGEFVAMLKQHSASVERFSVLGFV